mmetsp:Transcript_34581/g.91249  ORF Transcript_34581/g.91249 Transcript_34581/m.91249 type:complete len:127 (+) Transcript_34581:304-684(+)
MPSNHCPSHPRVTAIRLSLTMRVLYAWIEGLISNYSPATTSECVESAWLNPFVPLRVLTRQIAHYVVPISTPLYCSTDVKANLNPCGSEMPHEASFRNFLHNITQCARVCIFGRTVTRCLPRRWIG